MGKLIKYEIAQDGKKYKYWIDEESYKKQEAFMKKLEQDMFRYVFYFKNPNDEVVRTRRFINQRDLVFVIIKLGKRQTLAKLDRNTNKFYKIETCPKNTKMYFEATWMEIKRYKFIRYATGHDL